MLVLQTKDHFEFLLAFGKCFEHPERCRAISQPISHFLAMHTHVLSLCKLLVFSTSTALSF